MTALNLKWSVESAIKRGLAYVEAVQDISGEIPVFTSFDRAMAVEGKRDPSIFPTAIAAQVLAGVSGAEDICQGALDFLERERLPGGIWRHWPKANPLAAKLPPDLDDTCCASQALTQAGRLAGATAELVLANRASSGRLFTWIIPRFRLPPPSLWGQFMRQALGPHLLWAFFRSTSAKPTDIDAVVNANALFYLRDFPGSTAIVEWFDDILRDGHERQCDKWYDNPHVVRYFLARALAVCPRTVTTDRAIARLAERLDADPIATPFDLALQIGCSQMLGLSVPDSCIELLVSGQQAGGGWPAAMLYHGGRRRLPNGGFAPPHPDTPHWGSAALSTVFALAALSGWQNPVGTDITDPGQ